MRLEGRSNYRYAGINAGNAFGYTLLELLTVIMVMAAVMSIVVPATDSFYSTQRAAANALIFIHDVRLGRNLALENQLYHRIYFDTDQTYRVQQFVPAGPELHPDPSDCDNGQKTSTLWVSVLENADREFDPGITFEPPSGYSVIYFRPDGMLVAAPSQNSDPIGNCLATFTYGGSSLQVTMNAAGIYASEEYYEE